MSNCPFCGEQMQPSWNKIDVGVKYRCPNRCAAKIIERINELEEKVAETEKRTGGD